METESNFDTRYIPGDIHEISERECLFLVLEVIQTQFYRIKTIRVMTLTSPKNQGNALKPTPEIHKIWQFDTYYDIKGSSWTDRASNLVLRPSQK